MSADQSLSLAKTAQMRWTSRVFLLATRADRGVCAVASWARHCGDDVDPDPVERAAQWSASTPPTNPREGSGHGTLTPGEPPH